MTKNISHFRKLIIYAVLIFFSILFLIPFVYMISIAFASDATANKAAYTIFPHEFEIGNFIRIFTESDVPIWLGNSLILTIANTVFTLISSSMVIPQFMIFKKFGWINTMLPLIIPNLFGSPFYIFMLRQFIMRLPISLDEAAQIDGMTYWGIYTRIILPLIKPALAAVAIFAIMGNWNWFFEPMIYLNQTEKYPLSIGVQILSAVGHAGQLPLWNLMMAAAMILVIPMVLLFFLGQKHMFEISINAGSDAIK